MTLALASPAAFVAGSGVIAVIDPTPVGQAALALIVIAGYVISNRKAKTVAIAATEKAQEIHILVNSQKDHLEARIAEQDVRIANLETSLAAAHQKELDAAQKGTKL
jgi:hypothetical protein